MSQIIFLGTGGGPTPGVVLTLTGNNPVAVPPDGLGNINVIGDGTTITVTGNAGTNTLTISTVGGPSVLTLTGDAGGSVSPVLGNIDVPGDRNMNTLGNTVPGELQVRMNNNIFLGDLSNIAPANDALTVVSGDITLQGTGFTAGGNINMAETLNSTGGAAGVINYTNSFGGVVRFMHCAGGIVPTTNAYLGPEAGNFTVNGQSTVGIGYRCFTSSTFAESNTAVGAVSGQLCTSTRDNSFFGAATAGSLITGNGNTLIGKSAGAFITNAEYNTALGWFAAANYNSTETNNICIDNRGIVGDANTIRIGRPTAETLRPAHTSAYIAGVAGVSVSNAQAVTIDTTTGQLGSTPLSSFTWSLVTGASQAMASNNGYIANNAGTINFSLPAASAVGDIIRITGINNAIGWQITQAAGQQIFFGASATTLGVGGSLTSSATRDSIEIVCVVANTTWNVISSIGNITVV